MSDKPDDAWWAKAERRARRAVAAERRWARLRRALRWLPHVALAVLVVTAVVVAASRTHLADLRWLGVSSSDTVAEQPHRLLPEALESDPYSGTPAEKYPTVVAVPAAHAVGSHGAPEVARALAETRKLLLLSRLDKRVLIDGDVRPYVAALAPAVRRDVTVDGLMAYASRVKRGERLLAPPRLTGTMTPGLGPRGVLTVATNYVFVYALRPRLPVDERLDTHVIVRAVVTYAFYGMEYAPADRGAWPLSTRVYWVNINCAAARLGLLALPEVGETSGHPVDRGRDADYDPAAPPPSHRDCDLRATPSPSATRSTSGG